MSQADDIGNLFHRFGASADSYKEINTEFEFLEPLPVSAEPAMPAAIPAKPVPVALVEVKRPAVVAIVPAQAAPAAAPSTVPAVAVPVVAASAAPAKMPSSVEAPTGSLRDRLQAIARQRRLAAEESNRRALDKAMRV